MKKIIMFSIFAVSILASLILFRLFHAHLEIPEPQSAVDGMIIEVVIEGIGNPTCLEWYNNLYLLICDRSGNIFSVRYDSTDDKFATPVPILTNLNDPHGVLVWKDSKNESSRLFISERGQLSAWDISNIGDGPSNWGLSERQFLIEGIPAGNHQTNAISASKNDTLIWHSGSTSNADEENDDRNGALLEVNPWTGEHTILASGVRNSFDGCWVPNIGYVFTDNGKDWGGDFPYEEINLLSPGGNYGWPNTSPDVPIPDGTLGPIAVIQPHASANSIDFRPPNSSLPGGDKTVYVTNYGSWNSVIPVGKEIVRVDFIRDENATMGWRGEVSVVVENLATPLGLAFHQNGDLYWGEYAHGTIHRMR